MTVKILGGQFKGRLLFTPQSGLTRPTSSILRKAIFDICRQDVQGSHFLDLFGGSGAIGLEAISEGADHVSFIDNSMEAINCIKKNVDLLNVKRQVDIYRGDALKILKKLEDSQKKFHIVYLDPPYKDRSLIRDIFFILENSSLVLDQGLIFVESHHLPNESLCFGTDSLKLVDERRFASSILQKYIKING
ncbi:MAG: 16S rRNA (guanine(966)-N(2))-methyltransferase RsmD [Rhabdochlamydiaceae bacterium]